MGWGGWCVGREWFEGGGKGRKVLGAVCKVAAEVEGSRFGCDTRRDEAEFVIRPRWRCVGTEGVVEGCVGVGEEKGIGEESQAAKVVDSEGDKDHVLLSDEKRGEGVSEKLLLLEA